MDSLDTNHLLGMTDIDAMDDAAGLEEMRRYILSPSDHSGTPLPAALASPAAFTGAEQQQVHQQQQQQQQQQQNMVAAASAESRSLEAALAALSEDGRRQLLTILQLAAAGGANGAAQASAGASQAAGPVQHPSSAAAAVHALMGPPAPLPLSSTPSAASTPSPIETGSAQPRPAGSGPPRSSRSRRQSGSGSQSSRSSHNNTNSNSVASTTYFANAFSQFGTGNGNGNGSGSGSAPTTTSQNHHRSFQTHRAGTSSNSSSARPSPALNATTPASFNSVPNSHAPSRSESLGSTSAAHLSRQLANGNGNGSAFSYNHANSGSSNTFAVSDPSAYRSPAVVPGTSSSAFYSDNGNGDEGELLFTPLLSPALTASTHPGPSVGPLPESFANLGSHKEFMAALNAAASASASAGPLPESQSEGAVGSGGGGACDQQTLGASVGPNRNHSHQMNPHMNYLQQQAASNGISPMHIFSPLSSPAIHPVQQHQQQHLQSTTAKTSTGSTGSSRSNGSIKGASRNMPKTRPSPIIRPEGALPSHKASSGLGSAASSSSSKRNSQSFPYPSSRAGLSNPASPVTYHPNQNQNQNQNQRPFGSDGQQSGQTAPGEQQPSFVSLQESAQRATRKSPSPTEFDLSSANPAAAFLQNLVAQGGLSSLTQSPQQQQHIPSGTYSGHMSAVENALSSVPSPLDLNSIFGMFSNSGSSQHGSSGTPGIPSPASVVNAGSVPSSDEMNVDYTVNPASVATSVPQTSITSTQIYPNATSGYTSGSGATTQHPSPAHSNANYGHFLSSLSHGQPGSAQPTELAGMTPGAQDQSRAASAAHSREPSLSGYGDFAAFLHDHQQQQMQMQAHQMQAIFSPASVPPAPPGSSGIFQPGHTGGVQSAALAAALAASGGMSSAPLTPLSFLNMPTQHYNLLTGLLADQPPQAAATQFQQALETLQQQQLHQNQQQQQQYATSNFMFPSNTQGSASPLKGLPSQSATRPNENQGSLQQQGQGTRKSGTDCGKQSNDATAEREQQDSQTDAPARKPSSKQQHPPPHLAGDAAANKDKDTPMPAAAPAMSAPAILDAIRTSPAFKAVQERAAAALAEKAAKSAAKGRGRKKDSEKGAGDANANSTDASHQPQVPQMVNGKKLSKKAQAALAEAAVAAAAERDNGFDSSLETSPSLLPTGDHRKSSHKVAEQKRRDSLKLCFEELRFILPPINPEEDEENEINNPIGKRPGENNVGGQRGKASTVDPRHPNKGISKVALLRKSNEYVTRLHERIDRRDAAIQILREELRGCRVALGQGSEDDPAGLDALSGVDFEDLDEDVDNPAPTYKVHGIDIPGGPLSFIYKPSQPTIREEAEAEAEDGRQGRDERIQDDADDDDDEDGDGGMEYKERKNKRTTSTASLGVSTRGALKSRA